MSSLAAGACSPYERLGHSCLLQRFQRCQYADVKPCKTEGRGWGLYAQEDIKVWERPLARNFESQIAFFSFYSPLLPSFSS